MNLNKKFNNYFKLSDIKLEEGKTFKKNYNKQYNKRKNIAKNHFLLSNAFNITRLIKRTNNPNSKDTIPESYYFEENKSKDKLNIYNYKKFYDEMLKKKEVNSNEDELLQTLLFKIDLKNVEELLRDREKAISFQRRTMKGLTKKLEPITYNNTRWKTFNKTNSIKSITNFNNQSNYKSNNSINFNSSSKIFVKNNKSLSIDTTTHYRDRDNYKRNFILPKSFYTYTMDERIKGIFNTIRNNEQMAEKNSNKLNSDIIKNNNKYLRTFTDERINLKSNSIKHEKKKQKENILKNVEKIRKKKDIERILFNQNKFLFSRIKDKLHTLYKEGKKIPSEYLEQ